MWNKLSLRMRATLVSALCLGAACVMLAGFVLLNAERVVIIPITQMFTLTDEAGQALTGEADTVTGEAAPTEGGVAVGMATLTEAARTTEAGEQPDGLALAEMTSIALSPAIEAVRLNYAAYTVAGMLAVAVLGTFMVWLLMGRALRPLNELTQHMMAVQTPTLAGRLPVPQSRDEVASLTSSFNRMIERIHGAFESQRRFAQNAAHELKTPIASMLTVLEVSEMNPDPAAAELIEMRGTMKRSVLRMSDLVRDMLALQPGRDAGEMESFRFAELYGQIAQEYAEPLAARGIALSLLGDVPLRGNRALLARAFSNIIGNAVRYNVDGGSVYVEAEADEIRVRDTGIGIAADKVDMVFEPFYCGDPSRARALGGTGLGLAIAKQIFDLHGMRVQIDSESGRGTVVHVLLGDASEG